MTGLASPPMRWAGCKTSTASRPWRGLRLLAPAAMLAIAGVSAGGCSSSYQLGSLFGKNDDKIAVADKTEATGSARLSTIAARSGDGGKVSDADVAAASAAAADVFGAGGKDASAPWQNPATGAHGMITPLATANSQDGFICRDFLASVVREDAEAWLQGEACRVHHNKWVIRNVKPWKRA